MNKKGFTLVELLAVIVVLGLVTTLAAYSIFNVWGKSKQGLLDDKIESIENAAVTYYSENRQLLTESCSVGDKSYNTCKVITVQDLLDLGILETDEKDRKITNDVTGCNMVNDIVTVYRKNNRIQAKMTDIKSNNTTC